MCLRVVLIATLGLGLSAGGGVLAQQQAPAVLQEVWTVDDGLPVQALTDLVRTRDGYLWIATFDGLVRFDGLRFTVFNAGNTPTLPSNRLVDLHASADGSLWIISEQGDLIQHRDGVFTHHTRGIPGGRANALFEDGDGVLWVGAAAGASRYLEGTWVPFAPDLLDADVFILAFGARQALWAGTDSGLLRISGGAVESWTAEDGLTSNLVFALFEERADDLWIGTSEGLHRLKDGVLTRVEAGDDRPLRWVSSLYGDASGLRWVGTGDGLYEQRDGRLRPFDPASKPSIQHRAVQPGPDGSLWIAAGNRLYRDGQEVLETPSQIRAFLHDGEGSVWVATNGSGLYRLSEPTFNVLSCREGLDGCNVYPVYEDDHGVIWVGTATGGLNRIEEGVVTSERLPGDDAMTTIYRDRSGVLWAGTTDATYRMLDGAFVEEPALQGTKTRAILEDAGGRLWLATDRGLYLHREGSWTHYTVQDGLAHERLSVLYAARDSTLWIGTNGGGLAGFRDGRFFSFTEADGLSSNLVRSIYEDEDGVLWVGTENRGLNRLDLRGTSSPQHATVTVYRQQDGLFDDVIHQILEDGVGRLWMSTNRGIFWVQRDELTAFAERRAVAVRSTSYTERDGLRNREANGGAHPAGIRSRDGRLWFPTQDGVAVVDPKALPQLPVAVVVERFVVQDRAVAMQGMTLPLAAGQRSFEIEYTGLALRAAEKLHFEYRLKGFDDAWVRAGTRRVAYYTNVPPGSYTFSVRASYNGIWSEMAVPLTIRVAPYFYETAWFYGICLLGLVLLGLGAFQWRVRRLKAREQELTALVAARTAQIARHEAQLEAQARQLVALDETKSRFFANISHEFRTPLTLILGPLKGAAEGAYGPVSEALREQIRLMQRNSHRLLRLINQILDLTRLEAGGYTLEAGPHDLTAFVRKTVLAFSPLAERRRVTLACSTPETPCVVRFDPDALEKVLSNLLSNAFKFTPAGGSVRVLLRPDDAFVELAVEDTGVGISADRLPHVFDRFFQADASPTRRWEGTGIGLSLARELAEQHSGSITVESEVGKGSTFRLRLPTLDREHSTSEPGTPEPSPLALEGDGHQPLVETAYPEPVPPVLPPSSLQHEDEPGPAQASLNSEIDQTTVLVIEDHADVRAYVRSVFAPDFRVLEAEEGVQGLALAREALPDLIVSDVMMPQLDGFALCRALREDPMTDCIPVILLTARAEQEDELEGLETGADDYLTKPFDAKVLLAKARNLIALRMRLRDRLAEESAPTPEPTAEFSPFEAQVRQVIEAHLLDRQFSVERLAKEVALSRTQLFRRLRDEAGVTPSELIRFVRVDNAARLLREGAGTVSEVGYAVGFESLSHFSRCFRERFDVPPSAYAGRPLRGNGS